MSVSPNTSLHRHTTNMTSTIDRRHLLKQKSNVAHTHTCNSLLDPTEWQHRLLALYDDTDKAIFLIPYPVCEKLKT